MGKPIHLHPPKYSTRHSVRFEWPICIVTGCGRWLNTNVVHGNDRVKELENTLTLNVQQIKEPKKKVLKINLWYHTAGIILVESTLGSWYHALELYNSKTSVINPQSQWTVQAMYWQLHMWETWSRSWEQLSLGARPYHYRDLIDAQTKIVIEIRTMAKKYLQFISHSHVPFLPSSLATMPMVCHIPLYLKTPLRACSRRRVLATSCGYVKIDAVPLASAAEQK